MRKWFVLFALFLMLGASRAVSYELTLNKNTAIAYDNVQITYSMSFDEAKAVDYTLTLNGEEYSETLKQESVITYLVTNTYILTTSNIPAGTYNITLFFTTDEGSTSYRKTMTISPTPMLFVSPKSFEIVCFDNVTMNSILLKNIGNVPLDVDFDILGSLPSVTIIPSTFMIPRRHSS